MLLESLLVEIFQVPLLGLLVGVFLIGLLCINDSLNHSSNPQVH